MNDIKTPAKAIEATVTRDTDATEIRLHMGALALTFANGREITLDVAGLPDNIIGDAIFHGLKQKLVDAAAITRNPETGRSASIEDKYTAVYDVYQRLLGGEWNKRREGGGASGGLLYRALVRMQDGKKSPEEIKVWLDGKTDAQKAALRKNPAVAKVIDEIRAESGDANDGADLLAELEMDQTGDGEDA